ncbi:MAG: malto-oligosyltrehalose trehalohydrolase [Methyloceanibacter sp.]|uniref:malto-oligosyltrehalose trehalohydrolase n=1 Tax=Methyloceanibacter sp. TaxID=1965321 RepID=UPI003D9B66C7
MTGGFAHRLPFGAEILEDGVRFRLRAPAQKSVGLVVGDTGAILPMPDAGGGWFELTTNAVKPGAGYGFALADGTVVPDPAARAQIGDVHGLSRLVDPRAYDWQAHTWKGRPWTEAVIYELHTGTFSQSGDFEGVAADLDRLVDIGVTAIEIMPVAQFSGNRGWGYDGVLLFAPHVAYGGPEGLKRLVDTAHAKGLMVLLDVVYNHFGPDGNYLHLYAPDFFHPERHTPWGSAIAFERKPVRDFFLHNVLYWLEEYRFDGLRFDAVDQIEDQTEEPILAEMAREVRARFPDRRIHLTCEDDHNSTRLLEFDKRNRPLLFTAEWNDDWHHAMHALLTGEDEGYYQDFADAPVERIANMLARGFSYQGEASPYRDGTERGEPSGHLPPTAFINFVQNHDQIGNRAVGDRITTLSPPEAVEAALALLLLSPQIPLLYMGEEYGETRPFFFFTDFHGELADAVRKGRRAEFRKVKTFTEAFERNLIPDPNSLETFTRSRLAPDGAAAKRAGLIKALLTARRAHIVPELAHIGGYAGSVEALDGSAFTVRWRTAAGSLVVSANLGSEDATLPAGGGTLIAEHPHGAARALETGSLPPWSVVCRRVAETPGARDDE